MYVELKCKSNFSFLRGASHPEELIDRAVELGYPALALTDRDGIYALPKAYQRAKNYPGFKLIVGADIKIVNHPRVTLLVQDKKAYGIFCQIITESHCGFLSLEKFLQIGQNTSGLICLPDEGASYAHLKDVFKERLFLPLMRLKDGHDKTRTAQTLKNSRQWHIPIVASNDVHYHIPQRQRLQDVLTAIRKQTPLAQLGFQLFPNGERYLKSPQQMQKLFLDLPEAIQNTLDIASSCHFSLNELCYRYPSEWIPPHHTAQSYLVELTYQGAKEKYPNGIPKEVQRLICHELALIEKLHFADYFLTIYEIVEFAKTQGILCQGRGSAANSVVCYCLGITAIDPVRLNLLFERFISEERYEPPDIDVDFEHERREEIIQHIYKKYGRHRAAMVSAVVTFRQRLIQKELSKALGIDPKNGTPQEKKLLADLALELKGFPRHLSIHSGGFTLSADPLTEIVPLQPARKLGRTIIQWDKYDLAHLGLLKVDILSLGMLTALRKTLNLIGKKLYEIPAEDKATYKMIQQADTIGTFQIESRAQMSMLGRLQPQNFYDLVIEVAIVRPGPIVGKMVHPYLKRRRGIEPIHYAHPKLKEILGKTLGIPLFQEQVMKIAMELAHFTAGQADQLRRVIGHSRWTRDFERLSQKLITGLVNSGLKKNLALQLYDQIQGFAHYGFPESHAASFALLTYASCYLKCHFPTEWTCSLINSQPMGFYSLHTLIDDAKRHGVKVLPIDPNFSDWDCKIEGQSLRLGLRIVHGISKNDVDGLIKNRPYTSLADFLARTQLRKDILFRLALANVFASFGLDQRHSLWFILGFHLFKNPYQLSLFYPTSKISKAATNCKAITESANNDKEISKSVHNYKPITGAFKKNDLYDKEPKIFPKLSLFENIKQDYALMGLSLVGHPMQGLRQIANLPQTTSYEIRQMTTGQKINTSGLVLVRQRPPTAKGFTFATLEDEFGFLDLVIPPPIFHKYQEEFNSYSFLAIKGVLQRDGHTISILTNWVQGIPIPD